MKKPIEPDAESLAELPEIGDERFRRRPGRGHHAERSVPEAEQRSTGEIVTIEAELFAHFGSAEAVNDALREVVANKKVAGS